MIDSGYKVTPLIPRELLFGNPDEVMPKISPDGSMIAYIAPYKGVLNVWIKSIESNDDRIITKDDSRGILNYFWACNGKYIIYLKDSGGDENYHLYGVELDSGNIKDFTPFENVLVQVNFQNKHYSNEILIEMNLEDPKLHDIYHLDIISGELKLKAKNPGKVLGEGWIADSNLEIRGAQFAKEDGGVDLKIREDEKSEWKNLISWGPDDRLFYNTPINYSKDGKYIYLLDSRNADTSRLIKLNTKTGKAKVLAEDPQYDIMQILSNPDTFEIQAVSILKERKEWIVLDDSIKTDFENLKKLSRGDFNIINRDYADEIWLVAYNKDNGHISYFTYNRKTQKGQYLFNQKPELEKYTLSDMEPISFKTRDGLDIHGYITFPRESERIKLPLVLLVHGGPNSRDFWRFHSEAQWLANRGYVCLQVNYRGSIGYGKEFLNAGDKEWGGKMHDDLIDAVNWAIDNEICNPDKIAIYDGSYGGYAALVGATFTPDLFCCAVDLFGPSNLVSDNKSWSPYYATYLPILYKRIGNPYTEEEFLKSRSPLFKVDQIKIPILIAQGANDPRVKQSESDQIVEAMKKKGIEYEYLLFPDEGHGFAKPENRLKFYAVAEKFLAKNLGGRYEEESKEKK
jgi:dipeptidyl aminopeptidase/acylaminoacyl peptidase